MPLIPTLWEAEAGGKWEFYSRLLQALGKPELHIKTCFKKNEKQEPRSGETEVACPEPSSWNTQKRVPYGLKERALLTELYPSPPFHSLIPPNPLGLVRSLCS